MLKAAGIRLSAYLGHDSYIGYLPEGGPDSARTISEIDWLAPYHPGLKISPAIASVRMNDRRSTIPLTLLLFEHADPATVVDRLERMGLTVGGVARGRFPEPGHASRPGRIVVITAPADIVRHRETIATWNEILWIDRRPVYGLHNDDGSWVGQSGLYADHATPVHDHGIYGEGEIVGVLDTGLDADMCYFRDDVHGLPPTNIGFGPGSPDPLQRKVIIVNFLWSLDNPSKPEDWDSFDHGTVTAGTIAGDKPDSPGVRDTADGLAPAAKLVIQDGGYEVDDCADMPAIGCPAADLYPFFEQAFLQGARIHSNSYGDRENISPHNIYSDGSEAADAIMWDHPEFLLLFSAGNRADPETVGSPSTAKNVISVGATLHSYNAGDLAGYSSQGPAHDGRLKPDVTVPGSSVTSAHNDNDVTTNNCDTMVASGTSMACPAAAGLATLVREYFVKGFYPTGSATAINGLVPSAALLKAALIASATPMESESPPPPSNAQGWGRVLLDDVLFFPHDSKRLFISDLSDRFSSPTDPADSYALEVQDSGEPLRVVLVWTDYPSTPAATTNLVNDLNLEVESPSSVIYLGNVFSGGVSQTGGSADDLNNVEAVRIETPEMGTWTVRVYPQAIPQPAQGYALVATGAMPVGSVFIERVSIGLDDTVGGNADGILEPGEWVDLPLEMLNGGDSTASNIQIQLESLTPGVEVIQATTTLPDLEPNEQASNIAPHLRVHLAADFQCTDQAVLRFTYSADGFQSDEEITLSTGSEQVILYEDFESPSLWRHMPGESTASTGDWIRYDPDGTYYQPEDDDTPDPGTECLFTAQNLVNPETDDVDGGVVVARSGPHDISGHPDAHLRISRWFGNRTPGDDSGDYFRLEIREHHTSADVLLEELDSQTNATHWTKVDFRVADFITPSAEVQLKVSVSDGPAVDTIIEGAIDEVIFWDPVCEIHDPAPNTVDSLTVDRDEDDVVLQWSRPQLDPLHGEADRYRVYSSPTALAGYTLLQEIFDGSPSVSYIDSGAATAPGILFYQVIAGNDGGDAEPAPGG